MSNRIRGEVEVELDGETYKLRPSFEAIAEIEDRAGCGINTIILRAMSGDIRVKDVAAVIYGGIVGSGVLGIPFNVVGEKIRKAGYQRYFKPAGAFLRECARGEVDEAPAPKGNAPGEGPATNQGPSPGATTSSSDSAD